MIVIDCVGIRRTAAAAAAAVVGDDDNNNGDARGRNNRDKR